MGNVVEGGDVFCLALGPVAHDGQTVPLRMLLCEHCCKVNVEAAGAFAERAKTS